jgi:hypothetical protein
MATAEIEFLWLAECELPGDGGAEMVESAHEGYGPKGLKIDRYSFNTPENIVNFPTYPGWKYQARTSRPQVF